MKTCCKEHLVKSKVAKEKKRVKAAEKELKKTEKRDTAKASSSEVDVKRSRGRPKKHQLLRSLDSDDDSDDDDHFCCECFDVLEKNESNRKCVKCDEHAHRKCAGKVVIYKCGHCSIDPFDDDMDVDDDESGNEDDEEDGNA